MSDNNEIKRTHFLLYGFGFLFALLLCLVSCAMVMVTLPASTSMLRAINPENRQSGVFQVYSMLIGTPTPFQPAGTQTPEPTPAYTLEPTTTRVPKQKNASKPKPESTSVSQNMIPIEDLPASASISGIKGSPQLYTLDCEAQTAVDWARFFGNRINHQEFIDRLPKSDDPEEGFVGFFNGPLGQLPPYDYGIHAPPVASLLRDYGLLASAVRDWDYENIKQEIASGKPVIVWIVNLPYDIITQEYTASNGNTTRVARYEHTWIITAYNMNVVTVVDSEWTYNVKISTFLERWEALGKQAIFFDPEQ